MHYIFIILLVALLAKDVLPLGDRYILRGISEGIALIVGAGWILTRRSSELAKRYIWILLYLLTLAMTAVVSQRPFFVMLQVASLTSVIVFFIAYVESTTAHPDVFRWNLLAVNCAFFLVCVGGLLLLKARPELAFEVTPEGNRFRGLFNEPAMMGAVSGLLLGLAAFGKMSRLVRISGVLAAMPCLYLTGSRTSWGAAMAALLITGAIYSTKKGTWMIGLALAGIIGGISLVILDIRMNSDTQSKVIRSGSIETLSGRTVLWDLALKKYRDSPFLGYGFTTGSDALASDMGDTLSAAFGVSDRSQQKMFSLHSGYIQALLDSGAIGAILYVAILILAIWGLWKHDGGRLHGAEMYSLVFFSISNVTDTIIFGAAVFYEVFFWYLPVLAMSLGVRVPETSAGVPALFPAETGLLLKRREEVTPGNRRRYPLLQE
jgi:O-antigen ligase